MNARPLVAAWFVVWVVRMSGCRGPEHARRVVFLTGGAFTQAAREFLESVPNTCLEKPASQERLSEAIGQVLAQADGGA